MADQHVVIVGAGQAGGVAAAALRDQGFGGAITLLGAEPRVPYQRPPLSKHYLAGQMNEPQLYLKPAAFYQERGIELRLATRVDAIDRGTRTVALSDGSTLSYTRLLLATGCRPRLPGLPGERLEGVHCLRTIADVDAIRADLAPGKRLVVIGGGYIGLEVAAIALQAGLSVVVLEMAERILGRVAGTRIAEFFTQQHRERGVDIRCAAQVQAIEGGKRAETVRTASGALPADIVVIGVGVIPNTELAAAAGLACDNGIVVDAHCRTEDPNIFAAGDCTNHPNALFGRRLRLESVQNAVDQARAAAANLRGEARVYAELPWFWSNQYDLRLQIAGLLQDHDREVLRGDPAARSFSVFYLQGTRLLAVETVNNPKEHLACRKLIGRELAAAVDRLADSAAPLPA